MTLFLLTQHYCLTQHYSLTQQYGLTQLCTSRYVLIKARICSYCLTKQYGLTQLCLYFPLRSNKGTDLFLLSDTTIRSDTTLQSDTTIRSDTTLYFPLRSIKTRICSYCLTQQYGLTQLCLYFPLRPIKTRICSYCLTQQYGLTQLCLYFPLHATVTKKRNVKVLVKKELAGFVLLEVSSHFCYWEFC